MSTQIKMDIFKETILYMKDSYINNDGHYFENILKKLPTEVINYLQSKKIKNYKEGNFYGKKFEGKQ